MRNSLMVANILRNLPHLLVVALERIGLDPLNVLLHPVVTLQ